MKRFFIPLAALFSLVAPELTRAAPPIYPGVVPYEQLDTRNFYLGNYPILRIMPFMPKDTPPYLPVDTWSFAVNTNLWTLYAYDPPNTTWHQVLGLGGIAVTINPTDNYSPYRIDATTFGDSMLRYRTSGSDLGAPTAGGGTSVYAGGADGIFNFGYQAGQNGDFTGSQNIFNFGYQAGQGGIWDNVVQSYNIGDGAGSNSEWRPAANNIFNFGDLAGSSAIFKNSSEIYNLGTYAGASQKLTNSYSIYSEGSGAGQQIIATSANTVYNFGEDAGREMTLATVSDLYNIGYRANYQQSFTGKSHMLALGSGAKTTNTGDFVFGDNAYNYWFPGQLQGKLYWGPGTTNYMQRSGEGWIFQTTGTLHPYLRIAGETSGDSGDLEVFNNVIALRPRGTAVGSGIYDSGGDAIYFFGNLFYPTAQTDSGTEGSPWGNMWVEGSTHSLYVSGFASGVNHSRLSVYQTGTNSPVIFDSQATGTAGYSRGFQFQTNGGVAFSIAPNSGYGGTGAKVLTDNGTYQTAGTVITSVISGNLLWTNSPTGGGSLTASSNVIASLPTGLYGSIFNNSEDIFAAGENAGQGQAVLQSTNLYNIGLLSGYGMSANQAWFVLNFGDSAGSSSIINNANDVFNFGLSAGDSESVTNISGSVFNFGELAGTAMSLDKTFDVFNYGWSTGDSMGASNSFSIFNYGEMAGKNGVSILQNSEDIFNYGYESGSAQNLINSTNLFNYGISAGQVQQMRGVSDAYNYGSFPGVMMTGQAEDSSQIYNYGFWAGSSLAGDVADGTFVNFTNVYNYGPEAGMQLKGTNATYVLNYGYRAGEQSTMTGVSDLYNYGSDSGFQSTYDTSATDIYNYGTSAGKGASYTNAFFILNSGNSSGQSMVAQDSSSIVNLGSYAGANMVATNSTDLVNIGSYAGNLSALTNSTHVYTWGYQAGRLLAGDGYTNIYLFGPAQPTRKTNEFVFGDANYLVTMPGGVINIAQGGVNPGVIRSTNQNILFAGPTVSALGDHNVIAGINAFENNVSGIYNTALGHGAMRANVSGSHNTAVGGDALAANVDGENNNAVGVDALQNNQSGDNNFALGNNALVSLTNGNQNVAIGNSALRSNVSGSLNSGIGNAALYETTGSYNVGIGADAGRSNILGTYNTFVGYQAGYMPLQKTDAVNSTAIGYQSFTTRDNQVVLGNLSTADTYSYGNMKIFGVASDPATYLSNGVLQVNVGATASSGLMGVLPVSPFSFWIQSANQSIGSVTPIALNPNGGNVAVGTTNPVVLCEIAANLANPMTPGTASGHLFLANKGSEAFGLFMGVAATGNGWLQAADRTSATPYNLLLQANGGNVGIATNAPSEKLEVLGNIKVSGKALLKGGVQDGYTNVLTSTTGKDFFYVSVPNTNGIGGHVVYTVFCTDGTEVQEISGDVKFAAVAKGTAVTATTADVQAPAVVTGGSTLTAALAANVATNNVFALGVTATTSLTTTNLVIKWRVETPSTFTVNAIP